MYISEMSWMQYHCDGDWTATSMWVCEENERNYEAKEGVFNFCILLY